MCASNIQDAASAIENALLIHFANRFGLALFYSRYFFKLLDWRPRHGRELFRLLLHSLLKIPAIRQRR